MIRKAIAFLAMPLLLLVPSSSRSITSGWPAKEKDFQSVVQIWTQENKKPKFLCTGVVIAPDTVLSAASCLFTSERTPKTIEIFVSTAPKTDFNLPAQVLQHASVTAKKAVPHPENDLMLLFLTQRLNVEPALLLSPSSEVSQIRVLSLVFVAGYGFSAEGPKKTWKWYDWWSGDKSRLQREKIVAKSQIVDITAKELRIGSLPEDGAACIGDDGAPIFAHVDTPFADSQRLVGMFIAGPGLATCAKPSSAIRLDAFHNFIHETMVKQCHNKTRIWCAQEGLPVPGHDENPSVESPPPHGEDAPHAPPVTTQSNAPETTNSGPQNENAPQADVSKPEPNSKTPTKPAKRRLNVTAEGAGCSCSQVATTT